MLQNLTKWAIPMAPPSWREFSPQAEASSSTDSSTGRYLTSQNPEWSPEMERVLVDQERRLRSAIEPGLTVLRRICRLNLVREVRPDYEQICLTEEEVVELSLALGIETQYGDDTWTASESSIHQGRHFALHRKHPTADGRIFMGRSLWSDLSLGVRASFAHAIGSLIARPGESIGFYCLAPIVMRRIPITIKEPSARPG